MSHAWVAALAAAVALSGPVRPEAPRFDLAIVGGQVVDGSGQPSRRGDVGILDGRIAAIGSIAPTDAREVIDARGLVVAPGFIDVHTHADDIARQPMAANFVRMGVTTIVAGNCGSSALDVAAALAEVDRMGVAVNFATLIGHNTVRRAVLGTEDRAPSIGEMARMRSLVWRAMADGAIGFSTGLQYVPGTYASPAEIVELARIAANAGGIYTTHLRNEGTELEAAIEEALRVASTTRARVQISHLKVDSPGRWGASAQALDLLDRARARGLEVMADQYAYTAAASTLSIRFPAWALEGGAEAIARRLSDAGEWPRIRDEMRAMLAERGLHDLSFAVVASYPADPTLNGLTMRQVAARLSGDDSADAQFEAARTMLLRGGASMVYHLMSDDDIGRIMRHPFVALASDGGLVTAGDGMPHPRSYGHTARVLSEYVRQRRVVALAEAVRKMTSLPAAHFRLGNRGLLKEGYAADIVVFDPRLVRDTATYERPHAHPDGIPYVLVNGTVVVRGGRETGQRAGRVLSLKSPVPDP
jgi:N-acyl-D-amino-acid deacylase